jgi:hypothetical protein
VEQVDLVLKQFPGEQSAPLPYTVDVLNVLFERVATANDGKVNTMSAQIEQGSSQIIDAVGTAPTKQTGASHGSRMLYIDNLRVLLISMVIVVHLARMIARGPKRFCKIGSSD